MFRGGNGRVVLGITPEPLGAGDAASFGMDRGTNTPALPTQGQPAADELKTTLLEGIIVTPTFEDDFAEWQRRDAIEFVSTPFVAGLGFLTGTNPWRVNAPGDDSMEPATIPVPVVTGLKATAVGFAILRNASRLEEGYGVLSGIPESALRGWKVGDLLRT